ncbi:MAG: AAA family ATPase, partial [bacterium]
MAHSLPRLPLGISDFAKLREAGANYLYVDKTQVLFDLLQAGNYLFLARPRRFGKSLLCSTIKYLYEGRRELYAGLAIDPLWDWSKTNPVVHFSLTDAETSSVESLRESLLSMLANQAKPYGITLTGRLLPDDFVALLRGIHAQAGRRVVVIVDEYEKPVHDHITDLPMARKMRDVLSSFYGSLKGCDAHLEKLFITGIGRMVRTSIFSELNQMLDVTLAPEAAELCGYTESELHRDFAPFI